MALKEELGLDQTIETLEHECLLNIVYTGTLISKVAYRYFREKGITDVQFNMLMQLKYSAQNGLPQVALSRRLVVNKADITGIVDRLEKAQLIERIAHVSDRRVNMIRLTAKGRDLLRELEPGYFKKVSSIIAGLKNSEKVNLIKGLETIRENLRG